jgi:hypothetical protein
MAGIASGFLGGLVGLPRWETPLFSLTVVCATAQTLLATVIPLDPEP